ncbi:ABC transporter substrate-binding protein [Treponema parvum]|uniref:ABC transporter substrate-binding protein n=1 Tax=Treponema parvum TaxID=138851 RepID=A0A975IEW0_9SPIR|nr:ABC transporter substrate-binding protein [Treponema parvum]QTQ14293.1 ABC transporter substrate-binding protein [Treponema parvum]
MYKKIGYAVFISVLSFSLFAAGQKKLREKEKPDIEQQQVRIVNLSPPVYSMLLTFPQFADSVVGVNPRTFSTSNSQVLQAVKPNAKNIDTSFVNNDFTINAESLAALHPSLIIYYGEFEKKNMANLNAPMLNMQLKDMNPRTLTEKWEALLADTFHIKNPERFKTQWQETNTLAEKILSTGGSKKLKALFIFSYLGGKITVSGKNSYGDAFLKMAGFENSAAVEGFADGAGQAAVSMEQIHAWNPDVIFINNMRIGKNVTAAAHILQNKVDGADWSFITAVKERRVFDIPQGTYSWGMPCADSPLVPIWMLMKVYPDRYAEAEFKTKIKRYYKEMYAADLPDTVIDDMLKPIAVP